MTNRLPVTEVRGIDLDYLSEVHRLGIIVKKLGELGLNTNELIYTGIDGSATFIDGPEELPETYGFDYEQYLREADIADRFHTTTTPYGYARESWNAEPAIITYDRNGLEPSERASNLWIPRQGRRSIASTALGILRIRYE